MTDNGPSKEIDLLFILRGMKNGIGHSYEAFKGFIRFSIKNWGVLLIFSFLGAGIGLGFFYNRKTVYKADLTLSHTRLNNIQCADMIGSLTHAPSKEILAKKLGINIQMVKEIKSILYKPLTSSDKDSLLKFSDFKIEVKVYDPAILDSLQVKLLNYLESNEYAVKRKELTLAYLDKFEEKIKKQILAIDSLRQIVDKSILPKSLGNGIILGESIDPVKVYQEGFNLYQSQLKINEARQLNNSFEIVVGFSPAIASLGVIVCIIGGCITGFVVGLLWLLKKQIINIPL